MEIPDLRKTSEICPIAALRQKNIFFYKRMKSQEPLLDKASMSMVSGLVVATVRWRHFISWSFGDKETKQRKRLPTANSEVSLACRLKLLALK